MSSSQERRGSSKALRLVDPGQKSATQALWPPLRNWHVSHVTVPVLSHAALSAVSSFAKRGYHEPRGQVCSRQSQTEKSMRVMGT